MSGRTDRREFLKKTGRAGVTFFFMGASGCAIVRPVPRRISPLEKLNVAGVGAGGKGGDDARNVGKTENIIAVCDVDESKARKTRKAFPKAKFYFDFREMLEKECNNIDAVTVGTPDHTHAVAAAMAIQMGKHVFVQKPLTHSIWEARILRKLAHRHKVQTQMGNQGTASSGLRRAVEILQAGTLGKVRELHVWTNRPIWPQGIERPQDTPPVPEGLKWDLWIGPAPWRPYNPAYHPFKWRGWYDFGTGALGDMACHTLNMPFWGLKLYDRLGEPITVEAQCDKIYAETYPKWSIIRYEFPAHGDEPPLTMIWYDGGKKPPADLLEGEKVPGSGSLIVGEKGKLFSPGDYGTDWKLLPASKWEGFEGPPETIPRSPGHYEEWIAACKGGPKAMSNFDYAVPLTEVVLLGNLALRSGKKIVWNSKKMRVTNCPEAQQLVKSYFRKGWEIEV